MIGSSGSGRDGGEQDERARLRAAEAAVEGDQLLERAALVERRVVEAADHDVRAVREPVRAPQVLRRGRARTGASGSSPVDAAVGEAALAVRAEHDARRARAERTSSQPMCGCSRSAASSCGMALVDLLERQPLRGSSIR